MSLVDHARRELELAEMFDKDADYGGMLAEAVMELISAFAAQGHSGFSAPYTLELFDKLARRKPLGSYYPSVEMATDVSECSGTSPGTSWQCQRDCAVFSHDGGKTWSSIDSDQVWSKSPIQELADGVDVVK